MSRLAVGNYGGMLKIAKACQLRHFIEHLMRIIKLHIRGEKGKTRMVEKKIEEE